MLEDSAGRPADSSAERSLPSRKEPHERSEIFLPLLARRDGAHVSAVIGRTFEKAWWLHVGMFIVFVPAMMFARPTGVPLWGKVRLEDKSSGAPRWTIVSANGFMGYAVVNSRWFLLATKGVRACSESMSPAEVRGFSGHWMFFYDTSAVLLLAALNRTRTGTAAA